MRPGLPRFSCSSASVYYTEHKPKNTKRGKPGNEATVCTRLFFSHAQEPGNEATNTVYQALFFLMHKSLGTRLQTVCTRRFFFSCTRTWERGYRPCIQTLFTTFNYAIECQQDILYYARSLAQFGAYSPPTFYTMYI